MDSRGSLECEGRSLNNERSNWNPSVPLFRSKYQPPAITPHPFRRERLFHLLNAGWRRKLTTVTGPAGYGKTTLLRLWTDGQPEPVGWLRLDAGDNELIKFLSYMARAIPHLPAAFQEEGVERIARAEPARLEAELEATASRWIDALERVEGQLMVVMDGLEHIHEPDILRFVTLFLRFSPPHVHVVLSARHIHGIELPGAEDGGSGAIAAEDLALNRQELFAYVHQQTAIRLSESGLQELEDQTQGWFVGVDAYLPLIRHHRSLRSDPHLHRLAEKAVFEYFHNFMRAEMEPAVRQTMMRYSVARSLNASLADRLSEGEQAIALSEAVQRAWFLFPLQAPPETYRFHPMFASFLRGNFKEADAENYVRLQQVCSIHAEEEGDFLHAAEHALAGGQRQRMADLLLQVVPDLLRSGNLVPLLEQFTESEFIHWPTLAIVYANALLHTRRIHAAERIVDLLLPLVAAHPDATLPATGEPMSGYIAALRSMIHFSKGETESGLFYMEQVERELAGPGWLHRHSLYIPPYTASILCGKNGHYGMLQSALITFEYCLPRWGGQDTAFAVILIGLGECYYETGKLDLSEEPLRRGLRLSLDLNIPDILVPAYITWSRLKWRKGEKEAARAALKEAREQLYQRRLGSRVAVIDACEIRLRIWEHDIRAVRKWLKLPAVRPNYPFSHGRMYEAITFLRACIFVGHLADALTLGEQMLQAVMSVNHPRDGIEIHLLLAQIYHKQGNMTLALEKMDIALEEACAQGYMQIIVDEGAIVASLLNEYRKKLRRQQKPALWKFVENILKAMSKEDWIEAETAPITVRLTRQEKRVYSRLAKGASNQAIADELLISIETVKKHCRQVYCKLGVSNRKQAMQQMMQLQAKTK